MPEKWGEYLRERRRKRKLELEAMPKVPCACGCGTLITPEDSQGREVRYAKHHSAKKGKRTVTDEQKAESQKVRMAKFQEKRRAEIALMPKIPCKCGCGTMIEPLTINNKPKVYVLGHQPNGNEGKPAHNRIGDEPLTAAERQKRLRADRKRKIALMPLIPCKCGCGTMIAPITTTGKPAEYAWGHNKSTLNRVTEGTLKSGYGAGWTRKFKKLIRERDNYTCQRCGITQAEYGKTLDIHHLDHDKTNNNPTNLVCACADCNTWASFHRDEPFITPKS